jgi:integrase/recombinase XerD
MRTKDFATHMQEFLNHFLPELKNVSPNTISSYCDTYRLFLVYCRDVEGMRIDKLSLREFAPELVDRFLSWLETMRQNGITTRNLRLAALHSFARYLMVQEPQLMLNFQKILAIPVKKAERKAINPLSKESVALILSQPDTTTRSGRRDLTILCVLYDTAARVQEICDLRIEDVRFEHPASARILGKGRKTRTVPLLPATAQNLKNYLNEIHMLEPKKSHLPLFTNQNGNPLTRAGVTYILNKYVKSASEIDLTIPEKIHPHMMRHTKAMHIYEAGNNLIYVRDFLGHSDIKTTDIYASSSIEMKRKALEQVSDSPIPDIPSWKQDKDMIQWLKDYGTNRK